MEIDLYFTLKVKFPSGHVHSKEGLERWIQNTVVNALEGMRQSSPHYFDNQMQFHIFPAD